MRWRAAVILAAVLMFCTALAGGAERPFFAGADVSMLPEIEKAGGVFHKDDKPVDALRILRDNGCNLWRIRLFVNPNTDYSKSHGATQDLNYVRTLAKRIKEVGGAFLLDLHYSDTW